MSEYVVISAVRERTAPNTTAFSSRIHAAGVKLEFEAVLHDEKKNLWGILKDKENAFIAIDVDKKVYCVQTEAVSNWALAVDEFLRGLGYKGPKP